MAEHQLPKLNTGVRFPSPAPKTASIKGYLPFFTFRILLSSRFSFVYPSSAHFIIRCSLFSLRSTSPLLQRKVSLVKASRRDSASLVKGGGPRQGKPEGFLGSMWNLNKKRNTF